MNNKILARVVAVVLSVMMLGTVAFAAPTFDMENTITNDTTGIDGFADQTQKTMIAFQADSEDAEAPDAADDILAIDQDAGIDATVTINGADISKDYIIVVYGGIDGKGSRYSMAAREIADDPTVLPGTTITLSAGAVEAGDGKIIKNAIVVNTAFPTLAETKTVTKYGYKASLAEGGTKTNDIYVEPVGGLEVLGGGTVNFNLLMVGVPDNTAITFASYIEY